MKLSALVVAHNEEDRLAACLEKLAFADEIVVVLDKCTDRSKEIAAQFTDRLIEGSWELEGDRRNRGIEECQGEWIIEVDVDEHVTPEMAQELRHLADTSKFTHHNVRIDNWVGKRLVRYGWGGSFGTTQTARLFRKGAKVWGEQRVHPSVKFTGAKGPPTNAAIQHYVDDSISDMIQRFDRYTTARAKDLKQSGDVGSGIRNGRRVVTRFWRCFVSRKGFKEGGYGFLIAMFAALYPLVSHLKAKNDL